MYFVDGGRYCEVLIVGNGSFRIAAELLRWDVATVAPQQHLPSIKVHTKYFSADVALRWVDNNHRADGGDDALSMGDWSSDASNSYGTTRGGVIVVSGKQAIKEPQSAPLYVLPSSACTAFRVVLLCADASSLPSAVLDRWHRRCIENGFELVLHAPLQAAVRRKHNSASSIGNGDEGAASSFECIPLNAERGGLLHQELSGSARLLQMIHNSMWVQPCAVAMQQGLPAGAGKGVAAPGAAARRSILVIGHDERVAVDVLSHVGAWFMPTTRATKSCNSSNASAPRRQQLLLTHTYGTAAADYVFLPAAIFHDAMRDMLSQWLPPTTPLATLFVDDGVGPASMPISAVDTTLAHYHANNNNNRVVIEGEAAPSKGPSDDCATCVWWSACGSMHAAERAALRLRGVEVIRQQQDDDAAVSSDSSEDVDTALSGPRHARGTKHIQRLHELLSCAVLSISTPFPSVEAPGENRVLLVPLTTAAAKRLMETTVAPIVDRFSSASVLTSAGGGASCPQTSFEIKTPYYNAVVELSFTGMVPPCGSLMRTATWLKQRFAVILFVADAVDAHLAGPVFLKHWAPLLELDEDLMESERCRALWLQQTGGGAAAARDSEGHVSPPAAAFGDFPIEIVLDPWTTATGPLNYRDDGCTPDGVERIVELLRNVAWPKHTTTTIASTSPTEQLPHRLADEAATPDGALTTSPVAASPGRHEVTPTPAVVQTAQAADDEDAASGVARATCEPPRWMLVDPDTLRTVEVEAVRTKSEEGLFQWMHKMKRSGHRLRREDRHRQALILAECLGEQCPDEVHDGSANGEEQGVGEFGEL